MYSLKYPSLSIILVASTAFTLFNGAIAHAQPVLTGPVLTDSRLTSPRLPFKLPPSFKAGPTVEGISEYTLSNGLKVLLFPEPSQPKTTVNVTYLVGSKHENYGETGMAHLLEHLLFKGTPTHPDLNGELKKRGIAYNASTDADATEYHESFAANEAHLDWVLQMEADRMVHAFVAKKDLESEMTVVRNEMEARENSLDNMLSERLLSTAYIWHNYGKSTIGARSDVEKVKIERLQQFYTTWYQPDNAVLLIIGRFDPLKTLRSIEASFGKLSRPTRKLPELYTVEPTQDGPREIVLKRVATEKLIKLAYHIPAAAHADTAALTLLAYILSQEPSGRLYQTLVEPHYATTVQAGAFLRRDPSVFQVSADLPLTADASAVSKKLIQQIENFSQQPVTETELKRAKTALLKNYERTMISAHESAAALSTANALGDWRLFFLIRDRIEQTTAAEINRVAKHYFKPDNRTLGVFLPEQKPDRSTIPEASAIPEQLQGYQGRTGLSTGEAFDNSPQNIEKRTERGKLPSGARYAFLSKHNRGDAIRGIISLNFGDETSSAGWGAVPELTARMLSRGTSTLNRQQLVDRLDQLKSYVGIYGSAVGAEVSISTKREHLSEVLKLVHQMLRTPSFPEKEFEQIRAQEIAQLEPKLSDPSALASNALSRHFDHTPPEHPFHQEHFEERIKELKKVELPRLRAFHQGFYGADHAEFVFVGDFDPRILQKQIITLFDNWKGKKGYQRVPNLFHATTPTTVKIATPDKANAVIKMRTEFPLNRDDPDYAALVVGNHILGSSALKSRLGDRLRQKDGLSYHTATYFGAPILDKKAVFGGTTITAPQNVLAAQNALKEEINRLLESGVDSHEVADSVNALLENDQHELSYDGVLASLLADQLHYNRTMRYFMNYQQALRKLSSQSVNAALRKYIDPAQMSFAIGGDFSAIETPKPLEASQPSDIAKRLYFHYRSEP